MKYLFDHLQQLTNTLKKKDLFLFFDYDGTLCPIANTPDGAIIPLDRKKKLKTIAQNTRCRLGIISGREIHNLKDLINIDNLIYSGNHGLQIEGPAIQYTIPLTEEYKRIIKEIADVLRSQLARFSGVIVEDKSLTLSIHYRMLDFELTAEFKSVFNTIVAPYTPQKAFVVKQGKKVLEIRPAINWNKGNAINMILEKMNTKNTAVPFYFGDDSTDEDAFEALKDKGITIKVGEAKPTHAEFYVKDNYEVSLFLDMLIKYLKTEKF